MGAGQAHQRPAEHAAAALDLAAVRVRLRRAVLGDDDDLNGLQRVIGQRGGGDQGTHARMEPEGRRPDTWRARDAAGFPHVPLGHGVIQRVARVPDGSGDGDTAGLVSGFPRGGLCAALFASAAERIIARLLMLVPGHEADPGPRPLRRAGEAAAARVHDEREHVAALAVFVVVPEASLGANHFHRDRAAVAPAPRAAGAEGEVARAKQCFSQIPDVVTYGDAQLD